MKIKTLARRLILFAAVFIPIWASSSCEKPANGTKDDALDVEFAVPSEIRVRSNDMNVTFKIMILAKSPVKSDEVVFEGTGASYTCAIDKLDKLSLSVVLPSDFQSGEYKVYASRGSVRKLVGNTTVFVEKVFEVEAGEGVTVYGVVSCNNEGLANVVVSDGVEVVTTDKDGVYRIKSAKRHNYVFVSVPSGYEPLNDGVFPYHYYQLQKAADVAERVDFTLVPSGDQTNHKMLVFGDMHLANRNDDKKQFSDFTKDVIQYLGDNSGKIYAMTLGDMSWDCYWVTNAYDLTNYIKDINVIKNLTIYHTIGNHDHEMAFAGDFDTVTRYKKLIAPTYYSFNIGKVHYIVLDDIECTNTGAGDAASRNYNKNLVQEQIDWLKKDLKYVSSDVPLVVAMHAPLYNANGTANLVNTPVLESILKAYDEVHLVTGHTHKVYNVDNLGENNIYDHNSGAVCATWWWTGHEIPGIHVGQDGAPGGYRIMDIKGTDFKWQFKPTGKSTDVQFRTYDRNTIEMTASAYVPSANESNSNIFLSYAADYVSTSTDNYVYINVWDYDPKWKVEVIEDGKNLEVSKVSARDPLHLISYMAQRLNKNAAVSFQTELTGHMFRVQANSASSTLEIKVTDRFGNTYKESMKRPKKFSADIYK